MDILVDKKYKLIKKIGTATFSQVFQAVHINTGQQVAVKLQNIKNNYHQLIQQAKIMKNLLNDCTITDKGIPNVYFFGVQGQYNTLVMDLLGPNIQVLLKQSGGTFTIKTTLMLAIQMLKRIQYVHNKKYVHRDIKPQNFVMGIDQKNRKLYIIDFGISKKILNKGEHKPYKEGNKFIGTARYASINIHLGIESTRRDDLQSLMFIIAYFLYGKLPWQGIKANTIQEKNEKILQKKMELGAQLLFNNIPKISCQLKDILQYIRKLKYDQKPDYEFIKSKLKNCMQKSNCQYDFCYDWIQKQQGQSKFKRKKQQK